MEKIVLILLGLCTMVLITSCNNQTVPTVYEFKPLNVELIHLDSTENLSPTVTAQVVKIQDKYFVYTAGEGTILEANEVNNKGYLNAGNQTKITDDFGGIRGLTSTQIDSGELLIVGNKAENSVEIHQINEAGELNKISVTTDTDSTYLSQNITIELVIIGAKQFIFVGGLDTGLSCFQLLENGKLMHIQSIADDAEMFLNGIIGMTSLMIDGKIFLFVGGFIDGGVSSFSISEDGTFKNTDNVKDDKQLFLTGTFSLNSTQLNDNNFVLVSHRHKIHYPFYEKEEGLEYHGDGITIFRVNNQGKLTLSSLLEDTKQLKLKGSTRIEIIKINEQQAIVIIATRDEKSIQIACLNDKGILEPIKTFDIGASVYNGMTIEKINQQWFVFVGDYKKNQLHSYLLKID